MSAYQFDFHGAHLAALPSGILWLAKPRLLCVSDLHLGKSDRVARLGGTLLPPYETKDTLGRLSNVAQALNPKTVVCLGDSFDDLAALDGFDERDHTQLTSLMAGRRWIWIEGNHDPGPLDIGGSHMAEYTSGPLTFRHIAEAGKSAEISGHFHPKASISLNGRRVSHPCFLLDEHRIIMPAFGAYTGGLRTTEPALNQLMQEQALAVLTGRKALPIPMPRAVSA